MPLDTRTPVPPNAPRWKPNSNPASIHVPGLDTSASVHDQIEQIEQLITIKLQNIDENFSKIHNVLADKVLPAVKRYAVGTEPVREAAKFWTSFYEQAAQIRIPTYDDYSTVNELPSERDDTNMTAAQDNVQNPQNDGSLSHAYEPSLVNTESSFLPGQGAYSSTPATARTLHSQNVTQGSDDSIWTATMESPLVRLSREIQSLSTDDDHGDDPPTTKKSTASRHPEPIPHRQDEGGQPSTSSKGKSKEKPLLQNVLKHNLYSASDGSFSTIASKSISPVKFKAKQKTPIPKKFNPYLSPDTNPSDWSGVIDLRDSSITTPRRHRSASHHRSTTPGADDADEDDSFDGLPPGMSPPVLMSPARPPRSSAELGLATIGKTPSKEAVARITRDMVKDLQRSVQARREYGYPLSTVESTMSTSMSTPPSLSRYRMHGTDTSSSMATDQSFDTMVRKVGLKLPSSTGLASTPGLRLRPRSDRAVTTPEHAAQFDQEQDYSDTDIAPLGYTESQPDSFSDSDSLDEINNTAHPSAAFLMASQGAVGADDSFGSSNHSSDSLADEDANLGIQPVHPFAMVIEDDGFDDDSFDVYDDDGREAQEETVFGVPPAERIRAQAAARQQENELRLLGTDLLQDTIGFQTQLGVSGQVEESPTPASWANLRE